jgi:hypothetical protein
VAEVHFALVHHHIESKEYSVFTTVLHELHILAPPPPYAGQQPNEEETMKNEEEIRH